MGNDREENQGLQEGEFGNERRASQPAPNRNPQSDQATGGKQSGAQKGQQHEGQKGAGQKDTGQ